jgi:hypothetical protein
MSEESMRIIERRRLRPRGGEGIATLVLGILAAGCAETLPSEQLGELQITARANESRLIELESRQAMMAQQLAQLSGFLSTVARDGVARDAELSRRTEGIEAWVAQVERAQAKAPEAVEERAAMVQRMQSLIDAGQVQVTLKDGRAQLSVAGGSAPLPAPAGPGKPVFDDGGSPGKPGSAPKPPTKLVKHPEIDVVPELENPWARPKQRPAGRRETPDFGF